jgi:uncharacterized membrane protein YphA (DoxX/SURF4 family)
MTRLTPIFLVLLRLAIGWHFLFEGIDKLNHKDWSSAAYLRESGGPLAGEFRELAGDPVLQHCELKPLPNVTDTANVPPNQQLPPVLEKEWDGWFARFTAYYKLEGEELKNIQNKYEQRKSQMGSWLKGEGKDAKKKITKSAFGVNADEEQTVPQRLAEYRAALKRLRDLEEKERASFATGANARLASVKVDVMKLQSELLADVNAQTIEMKKQMRELLPLEKRIAGLPPRVQEQIKSLPADKQAAAIPPEFVEDESDALLKVTLGGAPVKNEPALKNFLPEPTAPTWSDWSWLKWSRLQWSDFVVRYGLPIVGVCLLLGLLTRTACIAGAYFLLMFYMAMPPLPGLPENPKAEGHYLYVNKNIIEMMALLALATTTSGRWVGLDGLLHFFSPFRRRRPAPEPKPVTQRSKVKDRDAAPPRREPAPDNGTAPIPLAPDPTEPPAHKPVEASASSLKLMHPEG